MKKPGYENNSNNMYVQAFVTNITFPYNYDEWLVYYEEGYNYDIVTVLEENYVEWTSPRWCKNDDIVFFMFSKTSDANIRHLKSEYKKYYRSNLDQDDRDMIENEFEYINDLYDEYGGKIFAVGRVCGGKIYDKNAKDGNKHWRSNIYAPIKDICVFDEPIDISEFRDFLMISRTGAITPVMGEIYDKLKKLIKCKNDIPEYFENSYATPIPLKDINDNNWIELGNEYRRKFFLEIQFRSYYVDRFLKVLGDRKTFYSECICKSCESNLARVDNVILFDGRYLPVEVKLDIQNEADLPGQVRRYCKLNTIVAQKEISGKNCYEENVLIIDTEALYLYSYNDNSISEILKLDNIASEEDIKAFKNLLKQSLMNNI